VTGAAPAGEVRPRPAPPSVTVWHNPRCSKSRAVLALLEERGVPAAVRDYLRDPPSRAELAALLARAGVRPRDALRPDAPAFPDDDAALDALAADPALLERPFVRGPRGAALCRPPGRVLDLL